MARTQDSERQPSEEIQQDTPAQEERMEARKDIARRSGGQGEVRSPNDGRLKDNLSPEQRSEIGRKGGEAVSRNREHMAAIGRKGGEAVSRDREHMADIGSKGGRA